MDSEPDKRPAAMQEFLDRLEKDPVGLKAEWRAESQREQPDLSDEGFDVIWEYITSL